MPYIKQAQRVCLGVDKTPRNAGELNYLITKMAHKYVEDHGECYQTYNDIMGALEGAKLELYRRRVSSYEDVVREQNGDV